MMDTPSPEQVRWFSRTQLARAWELVRDTRSLSGNKPPPIGVDGMRAEHFEAHIDLYLDELSRLLSQPDAKAKRPNRYRFGPLLRREVTRLGASRPRSVHIPRLRDQVVLKALSRHMAARMNGCGCPLPPSDPARLVRRLLREGRHLGRVHVLRTDIQAYFESIPHDQLRREVSTLNLGACAEDLIEQLVTATPVRVAYAPRGEDAVPSRGVPVGASVSSYLAQHFLWSVDRMFEGRGDLLYLRYMDDILLATTSSVTLVDAGHVLEKALADRRLSLSPTKTEYCSFDAGFSYLGLGFKGPHVVVRQAKIEAWFRRFQRLKARHHRHVAEASDAAGAELAFSALLLAMNREISGVDGMHIRYYSMADDLSPYRRLDAQLHQLLGGLSRRLKIPLSGSEGLASAHGWAWRYKRDPSAAKALARRRYGVTGD